MFAPQIIAFAVLNVFFVFSKPWLLASGLDVSLLLGGNLLLFVLSVISFLFLRRSVIAAAPQAFVRNFYLSFMIKFLLVAVTVLIYAKTRQSVNRLSVIICMALYIVYTFIEVRTILKESKKQNAK